MQLIGQFDSPFVRRVGIALTHYRIPFEHRPWGVWRDADVIGQLSPLRRVPVLVLPSGECLWDSGAILDALDEQAPEALRLVATGGALRRRCLRVTATATGVADKAVGLLYEHLMHPEEPSARWVQRCQGQIREGLAWLDASRSESTQDYWFGPQLSHADIAVAAAWRFVQEAHADRLPLAAFAALDAHARRCEALPVFRDIYQPFTL